MTLYISSIPYSATLSDLEALFAAYATVESVRLVRGPKDPPGKHGVAFVEVQTAIGAGLLAHGLNGLQWHGRTLRVQLAKTEPVGAEART